jgi:hypothetical protein
MEKKIGKLEVWKDRGFGIISVKGENFQIEKFFLPFVSVIICEPETPHYGCVVKFNVSSNKPNSGKLPLATDAEIYEPATVAHATGTSKTEAA